MQAPRSDWRDATHEVKRAVPVRQVMSESGWHVSRDGKRADCGLCRGKSDVALTGHLWHCHKCKAGGTVLDLVMASHNCDFRAALKFLASSAGIPLPERMTAEERRRLASEQARHHRVGKTAVKVETAACELRRWYRDLIARCERKQAEVRQRMAELNGGASERWQGEFEGCWGWLAALHSLLRDYLAAYSLLSFGCDTDRAKFVLRPVQRQQIINTALLCGFVDKHGKRLEVLE